MWLVFVKVVLNVCTRTRRWGVVGERYAEIWLWKVKDGDGRRKAQALGHFEQTISYHVSHVLERPLTAIISLRSLISDILLNFER
jgi:hypothetical protein